MGEQSQLRKQQQREYFAHKMPETTVPVSLRDAFLEDPFFRTGWDEMNSGCACANNTSKSLISASFGQRPEARGQRPEAREGTKDYKRSCKERINQIFPHHHTVFLMKM